MRAFLLYFNTGGVALRGESEAAIKCKDKEGYGRRNGYLTELIKHIEIIVSSDEYQKVDVVGAKIEQRWHQTNQREKRWNPIIFPLTIYTELQGSCPCQILGQPYVSERGSLKDVALGTFRGQHAVHAIRESPMDHNMHAVRTSHGGFWAFAMHLSGDWTSAQHQASPGYITGVWDEKTGEYQCLAAHRTSFETSPPTPIKADRPLALITSTPAKDTRREGGYNVVGTRLRLLQKSYQLRVVMQKGQPFTDCPSYRRWVKDKAEWLDTAPGAWEDWAVEKRRLFNTRLGLDPDHESIAFEEPAVV